MVGDIPDFYQSEALLLSFTRENLAFLEILGQWGKLDSEEDRYEVSGPLPFPSSVFSSEVKRRRLTSST